MLLKSIKRQLRTSEDLRRQEETKGLYSSFSVHVSYAQKSLTYHQKPPETTEQVQEI